MTLIASRTLDLHADVAEWCPITGRQHLLAVGTYELQEERNKRIGRYATQRGHRDQQARLVCDGADLASRLLIFDVGVSACGDGDSHELRIADQQTQSAKPLEHPLAQLDMAGIFDIKWQPAATPHAAYPLLVAALADGNVSLMDVVSQTSRPAKPDDPSDRRAEPVAQDQCSGRGDSCEPLRLRMLSAAAVAQSTAMVLSVDWSRGPTSATHRAGLVATTSNGVVAAMQVPCCALLLPQLRKSNEASWDMEQLRVVTCR